MTKVIAFYLPQFHRIPENDRWWGVGFTEWRNVRAATPQFPGHYQPHAPREPLGYYDLRDEKAQRLQIELAQRYNVHGFCYYYYWFGGKKLLDAPLNHILRTPDMRFPFCLCWANDNWTRAWYGQNKQILIEQTYSEEMALRFARDIAPILQDSRYIVVNGRPLLLVYQVEKIPEPRRYMDVVRGYFVKSGLAEPRIALVEAMMWDTEPEECGCDCAIEFAPDWRMLGPALNGGEQPIRVSYDYVVKNMALKHDPGYTRWRCVFPMWDNTPRYKKAATVIENDSPASFAFAVEKAVAYTRAHFPEEERLLFVNAWNEWGEGCHLEPDERHGAAWLRVLRHAAAG